MMVDVTVVGGGVSGLIAAWELMRLGHDIVLLERQVRVGGKAQSERIGGFLLEKGPSAVAADGPITSLTASLGLTHERVDLGPDVKRRYIVADGRLRGIATHPAAFVTSGFLSPTGRLRLLAEVLIPRSAETEEETIGAFCRRRFGCEFTDRVIDSLVCGMFAGTADRLSMTSTLPRLVEMEQTYGSILRGVLLRSVIGKRMPGRQLFSWREGVVSLPLALAMRLGSRIKAGVAVRKIVPRTHGFMVDTGRHGSIHTRAVVIATQSHVAAELLDRVDADAAGAANQIEAPPLAVVFLGYARRQIAHPLDGIGFLAPSSERRPVNGAMFCSTMFAARAPDGFVALAAYVGGDRAPQLARLPVDDLVALVRQEFSELLGAKGEPVLSRVHHWPRGLPQYRIGHGNLLAALDGISQRRPGLFVTGNYIAGVSVAACTAHASLTATRARAFLDRQARAVDCVRLDPISEAENNGIIRTVVSGPG
jgi:oxygen-dependent protoporphyrinogen oxidase